MNHLRSLPVCFALLAALVVAHGADASVRKCTITRNGLRVDLSAALLVVDGQHVGLLAPQGADSQPGRVHLNDVVPVPEDVLRIDIICLEVAEGDKIVGRQAVAVVTKSGAVEFMRSHLQALVAMQEEHRTLKGTYAESLAELDFFASRAPLPIKFAVQQDAWSAQATLEGLSTVCLVDGGEQKEVLADQPPNLVRCEAA